jgi:Outer membrane protein beta-barrel domain
MDMRKIFYFTILFAVLITINLPISSVCATSPKSDSKFSVPWSQKGLIFQFNGLYAAQIGKNTEETNPGFGGTLTLLYAFHDYFAAGANITFASLSKGEGATEMSIQLYTFNADIHAYMNLTQSLKTYLFLQAGYAREIYSAGDTTGIENGLNLGIGIGIKKAIAENLFIGVEGIYQSPLWAQECYDIPFGDEGQRCDTPDQKTWYVGMGLTYFFQI